MTARDFVDTNVLVYTVSNATTDQARRDAAIIAAAKRMGCQTVFSEDLNAGQNYEGVTVVNPFATTPAP